MSDPLFILAWVIWAICAAMTLWMLGDPMRGATAHEWQVGRLYVRIVHLRGGPWRWWCPWRRVSFHWEER